MERLCDGAHVERSVSEMRAISALLSCDWQRLLEKHFRLNDCRDMARATIVTSASSRSVVVSQRAAPDLPENHLEFLVAGSAEIDHAEEP